MSLPVPVTGVVGACLRDARERRIMLPEQAADALDISLPALLALEEGTSLISPAALETLTGLYRSPDGSALHLLLVRHFGRDGAVVRDGGTGHARRFAACADSAHLIRWQSTAILPGPLQTPHYARAVGESPVPRKGAPRATNRQLDHLQHLLDSGTDVRIVPGTRPLPQPAGHLVELHLPGGPFWARPGPGHVDYFGTSGFAAAITASLDTTDTAYTRDALKRAAHAHHALAAEPGDRQQATTGARPCP
ncbi:hypothetical protein YW3DRAFT_05773 [Streptomyces sp. MnatMP-M77]|uniref:Scr1 family TA system antitoxin-like transcriptional regulator n=1 Tax=unclassified Streptomyces TaxID=2593676 RepID=UPI0008056F2B|nr:Scr1 family TA system antitoxin-like transcriptional regulator [Streptomyces sp. MnatMP-M77]MYT82389.1 hypothetical protein [Streptomyces sp. SID8364]SBU96427.1 hypothetical protein YW3DRAFT_05773 [Streptomyces sp. MnatMP-M77]